MSTVSSKNQEDIDAVERFRTYLRINTMQPNPDYKSAVDFLRGEAEELKLEFHEVVLSSGLSVVVLKWPGRQPELSSVMLNSHMDVVPVFPECWTYPPFSAHLDEEGRIFARGAQDMKCVGSQYLEAVRRLRHNSEFQPVRNLFLVFVPDEEVSGLKGMNLFVDHEFFHSMNVGLSMDEGIANPDDSFLAFYGERSPWWVKITCRGAPGHGSQFIEDTAAERLRRVVDRLLEYRASEESRLKASEGKLTLGDVTTVNLTRLDGGVQHNVVPASLTTVFDMRVSPHENLAEFEATLRSWLEECAPPLKDGTPGYTLEFPQKFDSQITTSLESPWWQAFTRVCKKRKMSVLPRIFPAATDSRYLRARGYSAIGFSPMSNTPVLLHDHNEFLHKDVFLEGIHFYQDLIPELVNIVD